MATKKEKEEQSKELELWAETWGKWECPECGDICEDPNYVKESTCENGHMVTLSDVNERGLREAKILNG